MTDEEIIEQFEHWIEYEKQHKDKINKADELIEIQQGLLDLYNKEKEKNKKLKQEIEDEDLIVGEFTIPSNRKQIYLSDCSALIGYLQELLEE